MAGPEGIEEGFIAALLGVELNAHDLRMVAGAGADVVVSWVVRKPLGVSHFSLCHARNPLEGQFHAPEATGSELCELLAGRWDVIIGTLSYGGGRR